MNEQFYQQIKIVIDKDKRYSPDAYEFLMQTLYYAQGKNRRKGHLTGKELLEGFKELAYEQFGPMALTVLNHWGIYTTDDVGELVFNLVENKILSKTDSDTKEDFKAVFDFKEVFGQRYQEFVSKQIKENV